MKDKSELLEEAKNNLFHMILAIYEWPDIEQAFLLAGSKITGDCFHFLADADASIVYSINPIAREIHVSASIGGGTEDSDPVDELDDILCVIDSLIRFADETFEGLTQKPVIMAKINPAKFSLKDHFSIC